MKDSAKRKSRNVITDDRVLGMIDGVENLEMFLEENDEWQFHDSEIRNIHWNDKSRSLEVTIEPFGYSAKIEGRSKDKIILLDFHFTGVESINLDFNSYGFIFELEITYKYGFIDCIFDSYCMEVVAKCLSIEKPRFVEKRE